MAGMSVFDIAGRAMSAQLVRLNTTASNLANAGQVATRPEDAYRARKPIFAAVLDRASDARATVRVRYTETREGLRIEIIDRAGFSMFELGTDKLVPRAAHLMASVAGGVMAAPNPVAVRGHTDALRYSDGEMNNWKLSAYRAEATRAVFQAAGVPERRFARIEGVADREPFIEADPSDARNRRITVTLFYRDR